MGLVTSKTPLRMSFFGGGTDIPSYYMKRGGMVVSTTIDKYIYIAANRCVANHVKVIYSELEHVENFEQVQHDRVRETMRLLNLESNIEVCSFSDIPTKGTGLGSSSTFTVGLLNALRTITNRNFSKKELAEYASCIEIDFCEEPIGKQDQYAAAYGGFNTMIFASDGVEVQPIRASVEDIETLESNLMMISTGFTRSASKILHKQVLDLEIGGSTIDKYDQLKDMAMLSVGLLENGMIDDFGSLLDTAWEIKRTLPGNVTNPFIDEMYEAARKAGALGGKILGAGDGGYLLLYVRPSERQTVRLALSEYEELHFNFSCEGSEVHRL